jgi:ATP-binding cassette, subfamily B, bacterial PglK
VQTPSIISAIKKISTLLTKEEKMKWLGIIAFALTTSFLEIITASTIVIFAQVLNQPEIGIKYLKKVGFVGNFSPGHTVFYIAIAVGIIYLIKNIVAAAEVFFQNFSIQKMNYTFKGKLLSHYAEIDYGFYLTRNSSFGMQVVSGDTEIMFANGMIPLANILSESTVFLGLTSMIIYINPPLALIIFSAGSLVSFGITKMVLPKFYIFGQKIQELSIQAAKNLIQFFHAFKDIILLGKKKYFIDAYQVHSYSKYRIQAIQTSINALPRIIIEVLFVGLFVTTIAFLCLNNDDPVKIIGTLGGYLYAGFRLMPGLNRIINQLNTFKSAIPSIDRVYSEYTMDATKENYIDSPKLQFDNDIALHNVSFKYLNTPKNALNKITVTIKKGEKLGIIGKTGSGKSTFVDIITGLLKHHNGTVLIDGKYQVNSYQWHKQIGYVSQSIYLIDDTIEKNIAFGEKQIDISKLKIAIDAAQLTELINSLPDKEKTIVGERGIRLSGGERQRIAIARALYHNPEVLIFDEATSSLDTETESHLMETINDISKNHTVIMIAHRTTTLKNCDRILVLEKGKIKEFVTYDMIKKG